MGAFPGPLAHGNSKLKQAPFVRTSATVMQEIERRVKHEKLRKLFEDMMLNNVDEDLPRDAKQIRNKNIMTNKENGINNNYKRNFADNIQTLTYQVTEHPFVQDVANVYR